MNKFLTLSVHDVVDLVLRRGNLDSRVFNQSSMAEGTRLHSVFQKEQGEFYFPEYPLSLDIAVDGYGFSLNGRADGVIKRENFYIIDEIKTTVENLELFHQENGEWHLGQALFYAYMLAREKTLDKVYVRLTYIHQLGEEENKVYETSYTYAELETYVKDTLREYLKYYIKILVRHKLRDETIDKMEFPYESMRTGQQDLIDFAFKIIHNEEVGYVEAPTGIGKTSSVLYPALKELGTSDLEKIFYLTSKNSIREAVYKFLDQLINNGLKLSALFMTSKDSLCINDKKRHCNPDECPFARNYYDKINKVIFEVLESRELFTTGDILAIAHEYEICPFEFQLDLSLYVDVIVGDYNYVYDPQARLIRFFENAFQRPYVLLVDEAHNLPSRTREMYSGELTIFDFIALAKEIKELNSPSFKRTVNEIMRYFREYDLEREYERFGEMPLSLQDLLYKFIEKAKKILKDQKDKISDTFLDVYFKVYTMMNLPLDDDEHYAYYLKGSEGKAVSFHVTNIDSRAVIRKANLLFKSALFFSATLSPHHYYLDLLGAKEEASTSFLPSPFDMRNRLVLVADKISTYYKDRDGSLSDIARLIVSIVKQKVGNYFVFFPSYEYMEKCYDLFENTTSIDILTQARNMDNFERSEFLASFKANPQKTTVGFLVMGGIFSEGIDLLSDRLIGAIIVGVALPKITFENDLIKEHEGKEDPSNGFSYAYVYPGFNKVLQAAGRVIRSEEDKGVIVLVDQRFSTGRYKKLYKDIWPDATSISSDIEASDLTSRFWEDFEA